MRPLLKKILSESLEKSSELIVNSILRNLKFDFERKRYNSASEMMDDYSGVMVRYVNLNWMKFFEKINPEEDDNPPLFVKKGTSGKDTYEWDDVEMEMLYNFIEKKIDEGFIEDDIDSEEYVIIDNDFYVYFGVENFKIKLSVYQNSKNDIQVVAKDSRKFDIQIMNILDDYGVDPREQLYEIIKYSLLDKIEYKLKDMGVREKDNMIKFDKK
jgi:hypothetical protein